MPVRWKLLIVEAAAYALFAAYALYELATTESPSERLAQLDTRNSLTFAGVGLVMFISVVVVADIFAHRKRLVEPDPLAEPGPPNP